MTKTIGAEIPISVLAVKAWGPDRTNEIVIEHAKIAFKRFKGQVQNIKVVERRESEGTSNIIYDVRATLVTNE